MAPVGKNDLEAEAHHKLLKRELRGWAVVRGCIVGSLAQNEEPGPGEHPQLPFLGGGGTAGNLKMNS